MVRVLILVLTISLGIGYLAARAYQQNKLAQTWTQHVALQASLARAQRAWLENLDEWLALPVLVPQDCVKAPCLLETQAVESYLHAPLTFWQQTPLAMYHHQTYAIFEVMPCKKSKNCLRGTFVAVNEQGMQLRSQLVAQQNYGQISVRFEVNI